MLIRSNGTGLCLHRPSQETTAKNEQRTPPLDAQRDIAQRPASARALSAASGLCQSCRPAAQGTYMQSFSVSLELSVQ